MWRAVDDDLLERLEHQRLFALLWHRRAGLAASPLPARAAGWLSLLVGDDQAAVAEAMSVVASGNLATRGDGGGAHLDAVLSRLLCPDPGARDGAFWHHRAVFEQRAAVALCETNPTGAVEAEERSLHAWIQVERDRDYVAGIVAASLGREVSSIRKDEAGAGLALGALSRTVDAASNGTAALSHKGAVALRVLLTVVNGRTFAFPQEWRARAKAAIDTTVEQALAVPVRKVMAATTSAQDELWLRGPLTEVAAVWRWGQYSELVERWIVDELGEVLWRLYRALNRDELAAIIGPIIPCILNLHHRIGQDPSKVAYAKRCADALMFVAEAEADVAARRDLADRGLSICPHHRNCRAVVAAAIRTQLNSALQRWESAPHAWVDDSVVAPLIADFRRYESITTAEPANLIALRARVSRLTSRSSFGPLTPAGSESPDGKVVGGGA